MSERQREIEVVKGMWGPLGAYQGFLLPRDHSSSLMLSRAESGGGEVKKNYELFCNQYEFHGKVFRESTFLKVPLIFLLGYETALRVPDALFHSWKMGTIIATS